MESWTLARNRSIGTQGRKPSKRGGVVEDGQREVTAGEGRHDDRKLKHFYCMNALFIYPGLLSVEEMDSFHSYCRKITTDIIMPLIFKPMLLEMVLPPEQVQRTQAMTDRRRLQTDLPKKDFLPRIRARVTTVDRAA